MVQKRIGKSYGLNSPLQDVFPAPVIAQRAPTVRDLGFKPGQQWTDQPNGTVYSLVKIVDGSAIWNLLSAGATELETLTGDTGGAINPIAANIDVLGGDTTIVDGSMGTLTLNTSTSGYPISPFVVSTSPTTGGYTTIQSAINAAIAVAGHSATIYIQPGIYTENLDLSGTTVFTEGISIVGASAGPKEDQVEIIGTHTPPLSGRLSLRNLDFSAGIGSSVFFSNAVGSSDFEVNDCNFTTVGVSFDLDSWVATFRFFNVDTRGGSDAFFQNFLSSPFIARSSTIGSGTGNQFTPSGNVTLRDCDIGCRTNFFSGSNVSAQNIHFRREVTFTDDAQGTFDFCKFGGLGFDASILFSSTGNINLNQSIVDSQNVPSIDGTGAGTISLTGVAFTDDKTIATALTLDGEVVISDTFQTVNEATALQIVDNNITAVGSDTNISIDLTAKGTEMVRCLNSDFALVSPATKFQLVGGAASDFVGQVSLIAGTSTIPNSNISANDRVLLTREGIGASTALGILNVTISDGANFIITSLQAGTPGSTETNDVSIISYFIVREI